MCALGARSLVGQRSARPLAASVNDQRPCGLGPILSAFSQASLAWRRVTHFLSGLSRAAQSSKQRPPKLERTILGAGQRWHTAYLWADSMIAPCLSRSRKSNVLEGNGKRHGRQGEQRYDNERAENADEIAQESTQ